MIEPRRYFIESRGALERVAQEIRRLPVDPKQVIEVIVRPARREKTASQRGYWHVVLDQFGQEVGLTRPRIKEVVKEEYYGKDRTVMPNGKVVETLPSSEEEDRSGYSRLIDFTLQFAAEQGIYIRDPRPRTL